MKFSHINIQFNLDIIFVIQWIIASIILSLSCPNLFFRSYLSIYFETQAWFFKIFPYVSLDLLLLMLRALTTYPNAPDNCFFYIHSILVLVTLLELLSFSVEFFTFYHSAQFILISFIIINNHSLACVQNLWNWSIS